MPLVAYLSHPIGPLGPFEALVERGDNLENAGRWLRFLIEHSRWAIMCPWLAYTTAIGSSLYGPRALMDQLSLLERCDVLVQVGGWESPHMQIEGNQARRLGIPVINLTQFGIRERRSELIAQFGALRMRGSCCLCTPVSGPTS